MARDSQFSVSQRYILTKQNAILAYISLLEHESSYPQQANMPRIQSDMEEVDNHGSTSISQDLRHSMLDALDP